MAGKALLGISPGTRTVGLAVVQRGELVEWKVRTFKGRWSAEKQRCILSAIAGLCEYHAIDIMVIKRVDPVRSSPHLDALVAAMAIAGSG